MRLTHLNSLLQSSLTVSPRPLWLEWAEEWLATGEDQVRDLLRNLDPDLVFGIKWATWRVVWRLANVIMRLLSIVFERFLRWTLMTEEGKYYIHVQKGKIKTNHLQECRLRTNWLWGCSEKDLGGSSLNMSQQLMQPWQQWRLVTPGLHQQEHGQEWVTGGDLLAGSLQTASAVLDPAVSYHRVGVTKWSESSAASTTAGAGVDVQGEGTRARFAYLEEREM